MTKLQKLFLGFIAASTVLNASAEAQKEGNLYIGGGLGGVIPHAKFFKNETSTISGITIEQKAKNPGLGFEGGLHAGYYFSDNFRLELAYVKPLLKNYKAVSKLGGSEVADVYGKVKVDSLQLRAYGDLYDITDSAKLYAGAGVGVSYIRGKVNWKYKGALETAAEAAGDDTSGTEKLKNKYNIALVAAIGAEYKVAEGINLGVEYNFTHHGKAHLEGSKKATINGHSILAKVRFDI